MNKGHINAGEVINLRTLKEDMPSDSSFALVKTSDMEVIRMVIPKGRNIEKHSLKGEISVQCLEGRIKFNIDNESKELDEGDWLFLGREQSHSLSAVTDSVVLITILFTSDPRQRGSDEESPATP